MNFKRKHYKLKKNYIADGVDVLFHGKKIGFKPRPRNSLWVWVIK